MTTTTNTAAADLATELSALVGRQIPADKAVTFGVKLADLFDAHGASDVADRIRVRVAYVLKPNLIADLCEAALA